MAGSEHNIQLALRVPAAMQGARLDQAAARLIPDYSRARLQQWIREGALTVDGLIRRPRDKLAGGEELRVNAAPEPSGDWQPEAIPLAIVHEDDSLLVVDKPAGLVVHPAAGNLDGTLLNALLNHAPQLANLPRAGIVHRLDKDTTGLMVVAKTLSAHNFLVEQMQQRLIGREYEAVVQGVMTGGGTIDTSIGRHPRVRTRMAVLARGGKPAVTHYRVLERFGHHTHIRVRLETGRTHQIRVHMAHIGFPLVGDAVYAGRLKIPRGASPRLQESLRHFGRQALHAVELALEHPETGIRMRWQAPLPEDLCQLLEVLSAEPDSDRA